MQGTLDLKYLADRYQRGKQAVEDMMSVSQRYLNYKTLEDCLPDLLQTIQGPRQPATSLGSE